MNETIENTFMATATDIKKPAPAAATPKTRHRELARFLLKYGGREVVDRLKIGSYLTREDEALRQQERAEELTADLERMGPTYVKLGQILSTRSDLLPPAVLEQLARLQDNVQPLPFETVREVIEKELGAPLLELYSSFEEQPLGSASLGQVHAATLKDGRSVAVKVQRPGIREIIAKDMEILREAAGWFEKRTDTGRRYGVTGIVNEFDTALTRELDYELEAQNLIRLAANLKEFPSIIVPEPVPALCTPSVLTMDFVSGRKVSKIGPLIQANMNGERLADTLLNAYLKQVFVDGFFHADPHPGNVFLVDSEHVALLDVGLVGHLPPSLRKKLLQMLPAIYEMDTAEMVDLTVEIGESEDTLDRSELKRRYGEIVQKSQSGSIEKVEVSHVLLEIVRAASECGVRLPGEISTLGRTLLHLDKVGRYIAPGFDVNGSIRRHISDIVRRQMINDSRPGALLKTALEAKEFAAQLPKRANRLLDAIFERKLGMRIDLVPEAHLLENLEKIANRITMGLILAALIVGASQLMQVDTSFRLFGYPGFAMICFVGALIGGLALMLSIMKADRKTREEVPPRS